jgi:chemotaxis protein MotB
VLERSGVLLNRFSRIEGVADREPFVAGNALDPRNRRISITLVGKTELAAHTLASAAPVAVSAAARP